MSFTPKCEDCQRHRCGKDCGCKCHPYFYQQLQKKEKRVRFKMKDTKDENCVHYWQHEDNYLGYSWLECLKCHKIKECVCH